MVCLALSGLFFGALMIGWPLLEQHFTVLQVGYIAIVVSLPIQAAALSDLVWRIRLKMPRSFFIVMRSVLHRLATQLLIVVVVMPLVVMAFVLTADAIQARTSALHPGEMSILYFILAFLVILVLLGLQMTLLEVISIAVCIARWEEQSWIAAISSALPRVFGRKRLTTSLILVIALLCIRFMLNVAASFASFVPVHWIAFSGYVLSEFLTAAFAALCFAVYYWELAPSVNGTRDPA